MPVMSGTGGSSKPLQPVVAFTHSTAALMIKNTQKLGTECIRDLKKVSTVNFLKALKFKFDNLQDIPEKRKAGQLYQNSVE